MGNTATQKIESLLSSYGYEYTYNEKNKTITILSTTIEGVDLVKLHQELILINATFYIHNGKVLVHVIEKLR